MPVSTPVSVRLRELLSCSRHWVRPVQLLSLALLLGGGLSHPAYAARHHHSARPEAGRRDSVVPHRNGHHRHDRAPAPRGTTHLARRASARADAPEQNGKISPEVIHALLAAKREARADPFVLLAIAWQESRFDVLAHNPHSSARGLLQFTTVTWLSVIRDFGAQHGLGRFAAAIKTDRDGRITVRNRHIRREILALRDNPEIEAIMAAERLDQERRTLADDLGRSVTVTDLYFMHLLGPSGAKDFLTALARTPNRPSIEVVGEAARPNLPLFVHDGHPLSVTQTYDRVKAALAEQTTQRAALFAAAG